MRELIQPLTKAELLALFEERGLLFYIKPGDIIMAKINVLTERQEACFGQWKDYPLPDYGQNIDQHLEYFEEHKKREKIYQKYERIGRQIDSLFRKLDTVRY